MTSQELDQSVRAALSDVAPEADLSTLKASVAFRDQLDLDSMDFLRFVVALNQRLGVEVPESDYARLTTLDACVTYLADHGAHP
ncbi:MAG: acyl carrier protein [Myxococcaceae bacterium]|nr:acyl carrier protein [Myxococcaceae bacterium]